MEFEEFVHGSFRIRKAVPGEGVVIHELMQELSDYEDLHHEFRSTADDLENILFRLHCGDALLIYDNDSDSIAGVMLLSFHYSSFSGRPGIFIEDFYIREPFRGQGLGRALMIRLRQTAREQGFGRIDWQCLRNNTSAVEFYLSCGARLQEDWLLFRMLCEGDLAADPGQAGDRRIRSGSEQL